MPLLLVLGAASAVAGVLALLYTRIFYGALRARHRKVALHPTLLSASTEVLQLNDADLYASWRLARVNITCSVVFAIAVIGALVLRRVAV